MEESTSEEMEIRIVFERGIGDPSRIFRTMAGLIESTQTLDSHLAQSIGAGVHTTLVLEDVETASLKARLRTIVQAIPDEAVKDGEIKKLIGYFLLKAKHKVVNWCSDRDTIDGRADVKKLQADIHSLAESSNIKQLPAYASIDIATLLSDITAMKGALNYLGARDLASLRSSEGDSTYNPRLVVSDEIVRDLITHETYASTGKRILKVKKPDYLGVSKWGFQYGGHMIEAKVLDQAWLSSFQNRQSHVHPGDSLLVTFREHVSYGFDSNVVHTEYEILKVEAVIPGQSEISLPLPE